MEWTFNAGAVLTALTAVVVGTATHIAAARLSDRNRHLAHVRQLARNCADLAVDYWCLDATAPDSQRLAIEILATLDALDVEIRHLPPASGVSKHDALRALSHLHATAAHGDISLRPDFRKSLEIRRAAAVLGRVLDGRRGPPVRVQADCT